MLENQEKVGCGHRKDARFHGITLAKVVGRALSGWLNTY